MAQVVVQGGPAPADEGLALRTTFSHGPEDAQRLGRLCRRFGKDKSAMLRYAMELAEGSPRVYRHAVREHLHTIELLAREVRGSWPQSAEAAEICTDLSRAVAVITALFEPLGSAGGSAAAAASGNAAGGNPVTR